MTELDPRALGSSSGRLWDKTELVMWFCSQLRWQQLPDGLAPQEVAAFLTMAECSGSGASELFLGAQTRLCCPARTTV